MSDKKLPNELRTPIRWSGPSWTDRAKLSDEEWPWGVWGPPAIEAKEAELAGISAQVEAANKAVTAEQLRKLEILRDFLSIPDVPGWPHLLCLRLAMDRYAGFSVKYEERRGRKKKWDAAQYLELIAAIETIKRERRCGDRQAVRLYLRRRSRRKPSETEVRSLEARLTEARDPRKNSFARLISTNDPEHDAQMLDIVLRHFNK